MRKILFYIIIAVSLISCSKPQNTTLPNGGGDTIVILPPSTQESKIIIFAKAGCAIDTITVTLQSNNTQIKQVEHRQVSSCNGEKFNYKTNYSYDVEGRLIKINTTNPYTVESSVEYFYGTKTFATGLYWDTATSKKTGITKIRVNLKANSTRDYNHLVHDGDSVVLSYNWTRGRTYVGTVGTWDPSYGISGTTGNTYPFPNYPQIFQRYTDYLWNVDTADLILKSVYNSGNGIRSFSYNTSGQLIYADDKTRNAGGGFSISKQMDIVWDTAPPFLPQISKAFKDTYWIGNTEFPILDPIYKFDIENTYAWEAATDINFILSYMKSIDYDSHTKSYSFENTYTNRLLTHKIMRNNITHAIAAEFTISYSF
ncbi:hypothetical protein [Ferruginibacter sp.]